jgi:uncharacterized membrane protein
MIKVENSIVINRPVDEVFEFVSNIENNPLWQGATLEAKKTSEGALRVGSTSATVTKFLGRRIEASGEITEYEPNQKLSSKITSGPIPAKSSASFERAAEGQTKFSIVFEADATGFFKLAEPLVRRAAQRQIDNDHATLKDILEAQD